MSDLFGHRSQAISLHRMLGSDCFLDTLYSRIVFDCGRKRHRLEYPQEMTLKKHDFSTQKIHKRFTHAKHSSKNLSCSPRRVLRSEKVADEKNEGDQQQASGAASV
jgi:hypothetical protein